MTFPANPAATVGTRSTTDTFYQRSRDPEAFETLLRSAHDARTPQGVIEPPTSTPPEPPRSDTRATIEADPEETRTVDYITREDKVSRAAEIEAVLERTAEDFPGVLPAEEQARWDALTAERAGLLADIAASDERRAQLKAMAETRESTHVDVPRTERGYAVPTIVRRKSEEDIYSFDERRFSNTEERNQAWRDDAMRATEITSFPNADTDVEKSRDKIADLLDNHDSPGKELARRIKATGSPVYKRAFDKILRGQKDFLTPEEQRGTALAVGVDGTGGFAVPFAFDPTVIAIGVNNGAVNPYRRVCRVVPIVGTDTWNALTATAVVATRTTEAAAAIEQGPTFAQPQYIVKRVQAQITYSIEMGQDRPALSSEMAKLIQEAKDNEEETSFATGVGTTTASLGVGPVNGTAGAYTSLTTAVSVTLGAVDFDAVEAALPVRLRFNAQWFLNRTSIRKAQSLETTGGKLFGGSQYPAVGNPQQDSAGNTGLRLLMYPVNESPSLPTATTANIVIGTLLNPDTYVIVDRVGMSIQLIPFIFGAGQGNLVTGQQAIYAMWRNDARPLNVDGGRTLRYLT